MISADNRVKDKEYKVKRIGIPNKNMLYRLGALGLNIGSEINIEQRCLLNGPGAVEVNGQRLSLRQHGTRLTTLKEQL